MWCKLVKLLLEVSSHVTIRLMTLLIAPLAPRRKPIPFYLARMRMLPLFVILLFTATMRANGCQDEGVYITPPGDMQYIRHATYSSAYFGVASDTCWLNDESQEDVWRRVSRSKYCNVPFGIYTVNQDDNSIGPAISMKTLQQFMSWYNYDWNQIPVCVAVVLDAELVSSGSPCKLTMLQPTMLKLSMQAHNAQALNAMLQSTMQAHNHNG
jgi:hypothetical protein